MCGSVVRLGVMSYLGEMNGFCVPRLLVCNTLGEMNGLGLHVTSVGRIHLSARGPRHMVWKGVRRRLRLVSFWVRALGPYPWLKPRLLKHGCARLKVGRHTRCSVWFGLATIVVTRCSVITLELKTG